MTKHKIVWNDFEQALLGPKGEGQEARSNLQKNAIHHEIAAVTLFPRNDIFLVIFASLGNSSMHCPTSCLHAVVRWIFNLEKIIQPISRQAHLLA